MLNVTEGAGILGQDMTQRLFHWFDYVVFVIMLAVSTAIGIFFGCFGNKQKKTVDYLLGGKTMSVLPVGVSLVASFISGITMMGVPSEIYIHGTMFWWSVFGAIWMGLVINYVFLPVFFGLQCNSMYEYLERRFNQGTRMMGSILSTISLFLYIPIVVYVPALAFSSVSGVSVHLISPLVCIICIFYTMLGGLKAVVWTDFIQGFLILGACIAVIILGLVKVGGLDVVWERGVQGERIQAPSFDPSPLNRDTIWTVVTGTGFVWLSGLGLSQGFVVRYLSLPTINQARSALLFLVLGVILMQTITAFTGLLIYATYSTCDPLAIKAIKRADQLLPYYVMDTATSIPGLPGIFIAGVFSAALSTMSSALNSLAGTIYEDFIHPLLMSGKVPEERANLVMKAIVLIVGVVWVLMVFVVEQLGSVLELSYSLGAITQGALLGLFTLGTFFPWANSKGAITGSIVSLLFVGWLVTGAQVAMKSGYVTTKPLPSSVEGCGFNITLATTPEPSKPVDPPFVLYRIAFYYYTVIGSFLVISCGLIVSFLTGPRDPAEMDEALFPPFLHNYIRKKKAAGAHPAEKEMLNLSKKEEEQQTAEPNSCPL